MVAVRVAGVAALLACLSAACSSSKPHPAAPRTYRAEAKLLVAASGGRSSAASSLATAARSPAVLRSVLLDLGLRLSVDELARKLSARTQEGGYVQIVVTDSDAGRAAAIANSDAREVAQRSPALAPGAQVSVAQPAVGQTSGRPS
jgi:capsular polysaccharide biosynthesis protein